MRHLEWCVEGKMSDPCDLATYGDRGDRDRESVALMGANALMFCHK